MPQNMGDLWAFFFTSNQIESLLVVLVADPMIVKITVCIFCQLLLLDRRSSWFGQFILGDRCVSSIFNSYKYPDIDNFARLNGFYNLVDKSTLISLEDEDCGIPATNSNPLSSPIPSRDSHEGIFFAPHHWRSLSVWIDLTKSHCSRGYYVFSWHCMR